MRRRMAYYRERGQLPPEIRALREATPTEPPAGDLE